VAQSKATTVKEYLEQLPDDRRKTQSANDLPLTDIGKLIASMPADQWISVYEASRKKK
jgi:hypothetical protein